MGNSDLGLDVGQANELKLAFRRFPYDKALIKRLCETDILGDALDVMRGDAKVVPIRRIVDLSTAPELEYGDVIVKHLKQGKKPLNTMRLVVMDPQDLSYTLPNHRLDRALHRQVYDETCLRLRTMMPWFLRFQKPANICLRNFFFENQHLVPWRWRWDCASHPLLFWGTICKSERGHYVPGLWMQYGKWEIYNRRVELDNLKSIGRERYENPCVVFAPPPKTS